MNISGCKNSSQKEVIKDSSQIVISYTLNSYIAILTDQEEIKLLEDLFNEAEFEKSDTSMLPQYLSITFYEEKGTTKFKIDDKDVIKIDDGSYLKSKQISFGKLYSILRDYATKKKQ